MSVLKPSRVSTDAFTFIPERNVFVAEASDLPPFERVFDDACDEGLTLVSAKTGREIVFAVHREVSNGEGELLYWELRAATPNESAVTVRVFND